MLGAHVSCAGERRGAEFRAVQRPSEGETTRLGSDESSKGGASYTLSIVAEASASVPFVLTSAHPSRVYVGKSPSCELCLDNASVSRRHASLEVLATGVRLVDAGSTNGTWVNGLRVHDVTLRGNELVQFGPVAVQIAFGGAISLPTATSAIRFGGLIGASDSMRRLYPLLERLAKSDVPVLIEGETGTGKEVVAESLHEAGPRSQKPFVVFDCTTVPASLLESALFGHERGAFTGANSMRQGVFEQANGGTLFIDEIGDLDIALQARLLRAIERKEIQRVGGQGWVKVEVRVLSATRRNLEREIQEGRFRDDLFFRLAVARIDLPPLRSRQGDIEILAQYFWRQNGGDSNELTPELLARLVAYDWPGNVRELANVVAQRIALGDLAPTAVGRRAPSSIAPPSSSPSLPSSSNSPVAGDLVEQTLAAGLSFQVARERVVSDFERRYTAAILSAHGGNVSRAAAASGIARRYFYVLRSRANPKA